MTGPSLDLDALREELHYLTTRPTREVDGARVVSIAPDYLDLIAEGMLAVLALVDEQRKENDRLREGLTRLEAELRNSECRDALYIAQETLAGSPAATKEQPTR